MKVRMLVDAKGSPDGVEVRSYEAGKKYDIPAELASVFLAQGWAEEDKELEPERKTATPSSEHGVVRRKKTKK